MLNVMAIVYIFLANKYILDHKYLNIEQNISIYNIATPDMPYPSVLTYVMGTQNHGHNVLGAQKKRLIETVLLSTHNICLVENQEN